MLRILSVALAAALAFAVPAQAALAPAEAKMIAYVKADQERSIALLETWVKINSGSMNFPGVEEMGRRFRAELDPLGFEVKWVPMAAAGRAGHIVATHKGNGKGKRILMIGHLDTVFEPDSPFQGWTRRGDIAEGPGTSDMKGGLVIMVSALRAMQAAGVLKDADIVIVSTGDEEKQGRPTEIARGDLIAAGKWADAALDFESLATRDGKDIGSIARRSSATWTLRTKGQAGHSSGVCSAGQGCGAIYELARIIDAFRMELPEPNLTFNVGLILGGSSGVVNPAVTGGTATGKSNIIAGEAVAIGDLRTLSSDQSDRAQAKMAAIVARHLPRTDASLTWSEGYPAMAPTAGNRALLARLNAVNADLGLPAMAEGDPASRGAGDIAYVAEDVDGLVGLGAGGAGSHAPGETVDLKSLEVQAQRAAILMYRLSRERRP